MQHSDLPVTRDVVLIGGGHSHALVLRKWGMRSLPGSRITVINPGPTAPYSGMLPGHVAGHYPRADLDIDLIQLARFANARVILGAAEGIDLENRLVHVPDRPPVAYDICSINVGITSAMPQLSGFAEHGVPAKPLGPFAEEWSAYLGGSGPANVAVIGAGVAGAELAMAMAYALRERGRTSSAAVIDEANALSSVGPQARTHIMRQMKMLGVTLHEQARITQINSEEIHLEDGTSIRADFVTGAAGAKPYDWISQTGLAHTKGFIDVDATLRSSDAAVFAVGDCAHLTVAPRPKAGVYAVRQAPVLYDNLFAAMSGRPLRKYAPQKDYLKLISLGGKTALAERFSMTFAGGLMWRWKDHIDQKFMDQFRDLPPMNNPVLPDLHTDDLAEAIGDKPLCGGCGSKIGRQTLRGALTQLGSNHREDITPLPGDDAALLLTGNSRQVMTSDHLRAMTNDPVVMARIAAVHALGDIWAMGAAPQAATATIILPRLSTSLQERTLSEIMQAASFVLRDAGAEIVGGHSSVGSELTIGFTISGLCENDPVTLAGGCPGDALILTKPIGTGVLMAAEMALSAKGAWIKNALDHMVQSQSNAARILANAHAMTDVTGFGLIGHVLGMCEASGTGARLDVDAIPVLNGAEHLFESGIRSSLFPENRALAPYLPENGKTGLMFDPQTAGGLLAAVAADQAEALVLELREHGYDAACIGSLVQGQPHISLSTA